MRFEVECIGGELHEIRLVRGRLRFSSHSARELGLLRRLGERCGCLDFLRLWQSGVLGAIGRPSVGRIALDELFQARRFIRRERALRKLLPRPSFGARRFLLLARALDRLARAIELQGVDLGDEVGRLELGVSAWHGEWERVFRVIDLGDGPVVTVFLGLRWLREVWFGGLALSGGRLVLGRDGEELEVLDLASPTLRSRAVLLNGRLVGLRPSWTLLHSTQVEVQEALRVGGGPR